MLRPQHPRRLPHGSVLYSQMHIATMHAAGISSWRVGNLTLCINRLVSYHDGSSRGQAQLVRANMGPYTIGLHQACM